nr:hypothetical protein [Tanacetum cinerariifolium]
MKKQAWQDGRVLVVMSRRPTWLFDIDTLTKTMNYQPVTASNQSNPSVGVQEQFDAKKVGEDNVQQYVLFPLWSSQNTDDDAAFKVKKPEFKGRKPEFAVYVSSSSNFSDNTINEVNAAGTLVPIGGQLSTDSTNTFSAAGLFNIAVSPTLEKYSYVDTFQYLDDPNMLELEDITYFDDEEDVGAEADFTNLETTITVSPIPTTKVHKDHHVTQIIGDLSLATQTRSTTRVAKDQSGLSHINNDDLHTYVEEHELGDLGKLANYKAALLDPESDKWLNIMNVEMQSMKDNKVWDLVKLPPNVKIVGNKWLYKKKTDMDRAVHTYKSHLVAKGYTQTLGIDYEETFSPVADIRDIKILITIASFYDYEIWQIDVKTVFLNGYLSEENRLRRLIGLCQSEYIEKILKRFHMENSKRESILMQEKLRLNKSQGLQWTTVKNILKYLINTKDMFLVYGGDIKRELKVSCYTNVGYLTDADDVKSQTGYVFILNRGVVDWKSANQSIFATSSAKAEYIAAYDAFKEAIWVRKFISGLGVVPII